MKVLQISIEVNNNSVGRIAEQIGEEVLANNGQSYITYARSYNPSSSVVIKIGSKIDLYYHALCTRIFDTHCLHSKKATKKLIETIDQIKPDIVHLHHIHGYFLNMEILFKYLRKYQYPVVWTFHDCWSFTGHCAYFDSINCMKWKNQCYDCELKKTYPASYFLDRSTQNFNLKKELFTSINNITIVPVSDWLANFTKMSFFKDKPIEIIKNGIDLNLFTLKKKLVLPEILKQEKRQIILGVASTWETRKGLNEFLRLNDCIDQSKFIIVLVGLTLKQVKHLPKTIIGLQRTKNVEELASLYNKALVFVNPTLSDTYPTTNLEAIACGTPVITYNTGGSIEAITQDTGFVVNQYDVNAVNCRIVEINQKTKEYYQEKCINFAKKNFDKSVQFKKYISLYNKILLNK